MSAISRVKRVGVENLEVYGSTTTGWVNTEESLLVDCGDQHAIEFPLEHLFYV